jgi:hypothetical protein
MSWLALFLQRSHCGWRERYAFFTLEYSLYCFARLGDAARSLPLLFNGLFERFSVEFV